MKSLYTPLPQNRDDNFIINSAIPHLMVYQLLFKHKFVLFVLKHDTHDISQLTHFKTIASDHSSLHICYRLIVDPINNFAYMHLNYAGQRPWPA